MKRLWLYVAVLLIGMVVWIAVYLRSRAVAPDVAVGGAEGGAPMMPASKLLEQGVSRAGAPAVGDVSGSGLVLARLASSQPERYLIRTASVTLEVSETREAVEQLSQLVRERQGYVSDLQEWTDELGNQSAVVTFRVPARRFDEVLREVKALGKALSVQVSSEDVTEEYVDVEAQLRNLKRTEERLLGHLSRTGRLSDTLAVERELSRVRQEIERLEGRLRFLSHRVEYCTVSVTLRPRARVQPLVPAETFSTGKVASDAVRALVAFAQRVWSVVVWLAVWAVVWLPIAAMSWIGYRRWRRA
ncbi:MAG: DUF4349 domain-containing protein [Armatimonadota bacterium]|nr:DUF4349 domain-containing protein [bacterium]MCS7309015.1 DUF4349 domain-containing protein [Armatimonadota bacterium]MDW8104521.1 DUF4349 domain-containing protein [Armatimonadota bacterium]MDW8289096.1 DUF4349 domain-containing protein [Armatimonadota bacterium]